MDNREFREAGPSKSPVPDIVVVDEDDIKLDSTLPTFKLPNTIDSTKKSREKVNVGSGYSMVEWMRKNSEKNLVNNTVREIGLDELALHNKKDDIWIALRGQVYDVTAYVRYHPGGVAELLKGAGIDATGLFNQIHRWVNFENILKGNQVGILVRTENSILERLEKLIKFTQSSSDSSSSVVPLTNFEQDDDHLYFKVDSMLVNRQMDENNWSISILEKEKFLLKLFMKPPELYIAHLKLLESLNSDKITLTFQNNCKKMTVILEKPVKKKWDDFGAPLPNNNKIMDISRAIEDMNKATLISKERLTHDTFLFAFEVVSSCRIGLPIGFHLKIRIDGIGRRSYTPICKSILHSKEEEGESCSSTSNTEKVEENVEMKATNKSQIIYCIIKIYEDGIFTSKLDSLPVGASSSDRILLGTSTGSFDIDWINGIESIILIAAGTGITPFIRIIEYILNKNLKLGEDEKKTNIFLIFFNKTKKDIIWDETWQSLDKTYDWFKFFPVLTRAAEEDDWGEGLIGRICPQLIFKISTLTGEVKKDSQRFMVCGSDEFNLIASKAIETLGIPPKKIFAFDG